MKSAFQIQILQDSRFILRRENDAWEAEFSSLQKALAYADSLPDSEDAQMTVLDEKGVRYMKVVA